MQIWKTTFPTFNADISTRISGYEYRNHWIAEITKKKKGYTSLKYINIEEYYFVIYFLMIVYDVKIYLLWLHLNFDFKSQSRFPFYPETVSYSSTVVSSSGTHLSVLV